MPTSHKVATVVLQKRLRDRERHEVGFCVSSSYRVYDNCMSAVESFHKSALVLGRQHNKKSDGKFSATYQAFFRTSLLSSGDMFCVEGS